MIITLRRTFQQKGHLTTTSGKQVVSGTVTTKHTSVGQLTCVTEKSFYVTGNLEIYPKSTHMLVVSRKNLAMGSKFLEQMIIHSNYVLHVNYTRTESSKLY